MNVKMLKFLVELSHGEIDCINVAAFFSQFPNNRDTLRELQLLHQSGYVSLLHADNEIEEIGVNKKALDYLKK